MHKTPRVARWSAQTHPLKTRVVVNKQDSKTLQYYDDTKVLPFEYLPQFDRRTPKTIPRELDPFVYFRDAVVPAIDQGTCGSCWAFASAMSLTERLNFTSGRRVLNKCLSPAVMVACDDSNAQQLEESTAGSRDYNEVVRKIEDTIAQYGCHGNYLSHATVFLHLYGTYSARCGPYDLGEASSTVQSEGYRRTNFGFMTEFVQDRHLGFDDDDLQKTSCFDYRSNVGFPEGCGACVGRVLYNQQAYFEPPRLYRTLFAYDLPGSETRETVIMTDIMKWGPILSSFVVYPDFYDFRPGDDRVYSHDNGVSLNNNHTAAIGGHAVVISGWGVDRKTGVPYWWIKNSWGVDYGTRGYFKMRRGKNDCGIEENAIGIIPNPFPKNPQDLEQTMQALQTHHGFRTKPGSVFPRMMRDFLVRNCPPGQKAWSLSMVQRHPIVDFFFFHARFLMLFHLDPSTGFNINYVRDLKGLDFEWRHRLSFV